MDKQQNKTPLVRFPEFKDDWEVKKLGEVGKTFNGLSGKTKEDFGTGKPYIQYKQIFDDSKINISNFGLVNVLGNEKQNVAQFGDVFFTLSSETPIEIGMSSVLLEKVSELYLNSFCFGFRPNSLNELNPYFLKYLFRSENARKEIVKLAQGSTRYNMSKVQFVKIKVSIPSLKEQKKIAHFFSIVEQKINQLQEKKTALESYKKGMMQKIFAAGGKSITNKPITNYKSESSEIVGSKSRNSEFLIPNCIRFKDDNGKDFPNWEVKKLDKVFSIFNGYAFSSTSSVGNGIVWVKIADVGIQQMKKNSLSFLPEIFAEKHSKFILKKGDYVIALTRPILNGELKIAKIDDFFDNSLLNQRVGKIVSKNNTTYIYYVLQQDWLINVIENNIAGTDPPNLSPKEINHIKLSVPEISEQIKIANFLSKIDQKIMNCELQITNTKEYKKGLLQKMFV